MRVFFLRPEENSDRILQEIIDMIKGSSGLIKAAVAYITHPDIVQAVIDRTNAGKGTHLIINTSDILRPVHSNETNVVISKQLLSLIDVSTKKTNLQIKSLGLKGAGNYQNMHHKFILNKSTAIHGSLNWTSAALNQNYECVSINSTPEVVAQFNREFDYLWSIAYDIFTNEGKIRGIVCPNCNTEEYVDMESYGPFCTFCGHRFIVNK